MSRRTVRAALAAFGAILPAAGTHPARAADATPVVVPVPNVPPSERELLTLRRPLTPEEQARLDWIRNHRGPPRPRAAVAKPAAAKPPPPPPEDHVPKPIDEAADPHMCQVEYNPNRALKVHAAVGDTMVFQFGEGETLGGGFFSDTVSLQRAAGANMVFLKAMKPMADQPFQIRMVTPEGKQRLYVVEWSTGERGCYSIKYRYSAEEAERRRKERADVQAALRSRAVEQSLAPGVVAPAAAPMPLAGPPPGANTNYGLRGDAGLLPRVQGRTP